MAEAAAGCGWRIGPAARLRLLEEGDAAELHRLIAANREHLAAWLPWAAAQSEADTAAFLAGTRRQLRDNDGFQTAILLDGEIAGVAGFIGVDWVNRDTVVGYWLAAERQGRGTMTAAVRTLSDHALGVWDLNRVEIRVATGNSRSRAIPERLGFTEEAVFRRAQQVGGRALDLAVYSLVAGEAPASAQAPQQP